MDSFSENRWSHNWSCPDNSWWNDGVRHHISVEWEVTAWPLDSMEEWVYVELPWSLCSKHGEFACLFLKLFKSQLYVCKRSAGLQAPGGKQVVWADFQLPKSIWAGAPGKYQGADPAPPGACAALSTAEGVESRELSVALAWGLSLHHPWTTRVQAILLLLVLRRGPRGPCRRATGLQTQRSNPGQKQQH